MIDVIASIQRGKAKTSLSFKTRNGVFFAFLRLRSKKLLLFLTATKFCPDYFFSLY